MKVQTTQANGNQRKGFTLVELVVVVLILGIIAAVAAPKMFNTSNDAKINTTKQSLAVLRNAIELYRSQNSSYPTTIVQIQTMLNGPFPKSYVPGAASDGDVLIQTAGTALAQSGTKDWQYDSTSGEFIINTTGYTAF